MKRRNKLAIACLLAVLLPGFAMTATAQDAGINFEKGLSWKEIKEKAQKENKYILMDCYATWCAPCKLMEDSIFQKQEVGAALNSKFINVRVQLDKNAKDNEEVRRWYDDAAAIAKEYGVMAVPTFFYFSPAGKLVHLFVGTTTDPKIFIEKSVEALNPAEQYFTKMEKAIKFTGNNPESLKKLLQDAKKNYDGVNLKTLTDAYLDFTKDMYTPEHLLFVAELTNSHADKGFAIFRDKANKVNETMGKGYAEMKVAKTVLQETGAVAAVSGDAIPNFVAIEQVIKAIVPERTERLLEMLKIHYNLEKKNYDEFVKLMDLYVKKYADQFYPDELIGYAGTSLFLTDPDVQQAAVNWSTLAVSAKGTPENLGIQSAVLYKAGKKEEAIATLKKAIELLEKDPAKAGTLNAYKENLSQMEKGTL